MDEHTKRAADQLEAEHTILQGEDLRVYMDEVVVLLGLAVVELLQGKKFDKREMANDLLPMVQMLGASIRHRQLTNEEVK